MFRSVYNTCILLYCKYRAIFFRSVCKVEWKVVTPGTWDVEKIAETMNQLAALLNETIKIRFVRTGSLILSTTVPCNIMKDRNQFHTAVHSLFVKIVEVCDLDVEKPNTIKAFLSVEYPIGNFILVCCHKKC